MSVITVTVAVISQDDLSQNKESKDVEEKKKKKKHKILTQMIQKFSLLVSVHKGSFTKLSRKW